MSCRLAHIWLRPVLVSHWLVAATALPAVSHVAAYSTLETALKAYLLQHQLWSVQALDQRLLWMRAMPPQRREQRATAHPPLKLARVYPTVAGLAVAWCQAINLASCLSGF